MMPLGHAVVLSGMFVGSECSCILGARGASVCKRVVAAAVCSGNVIAAPATAWYAGCRVHCIWQAGV